MYIESIVLFYDMHRNSYPLNEFLIKLNRIVTMNQMVKKIIISNNNNKKKEERTDKRTFRRIYM